MYRHRALVPFHAAAGGENSGGILRETVNKFKPEFDLIQKYLRPVWRNDGLDPPIRKRR